MTVGVGSAGVPFPGGGGGSGSLDDALGCGAGVPDSGCSSVVVDLGSVGLGVGVVGVVLSRDPLGAGVRLVGARSLGGGCVGSGGPTQGGDAVGAEDGGPEPPSSHGS